VAFVPAEEVLAYLSLAGLKGGQGEMPAWMVFTQGNHNYWKS